MDIQSDPLTLLNLPSTWVVSWPVSSSNAISTTLCDATPPDMKYGAVTEAFQYGENGDLASETIAAFHTGEGEPWSDAFQQSLACAQFDEAGPPGTPIPTHISGLTPVSLGDQAFSYQIITTIGAQTLETVVIYFRDGDNAIQLGDSVNGTVDQEPINSLEQ